MDAVLEEVAARIIQHHWRDRRQCEGARAGRSHPPLPPASAYDGHGSVLDFIPLKERAAGDRPTSSERPPSRPPRPRSRGTFSPAATAGSGACGPSLQCITPKPPLELEDSAERTSFKGNNTSSKGAATLLGSDAAPAPSCRPSNLPSPTPQQQAATAAAPCRPFSPTSCHLPAVDVHPSDPSEQLGRIWQMMEALEQQAAEEARQVGPSQPAPNAALDKRLDGQQQPCGQPAPLKTHPLAKLLASQPCSIASKQMLAAATGTAAAHAACLAEGSRACRKSTQLLATQLKQPSRAAAAGVLNPGCAAAAKAAAAPSATQHLPQAALDPSAVASSVRAKIRQLQQQVEQKDGQMAALLEQLEETRQQQAAALAAAETRHQAQLESYKSEGEASANQSRQLLDAVARENDALTAKCAKLLADVGALQAEAEKQIAALKEVLARELRKQKEVWMASERAKREAWMAEQTRSIKERTIKGLEPELQRLVVEHQAELKNAEARHEAKAGSVMQAAIAQHEEQLAAVQAAAAAERAAAADAERAAAREQVKDAQSRFEIELQSLRMRLATEHQMQLERADAARREDSARLQQHTLESEQRVGALRAEWEREKQQLVQAQQLEVATLRQQLHADQETWRAAAAEQARREMESRVAELRRQLGAERDEELAAVVARLEDDAVAREAAHEAAVEAKWQEHIERLRAAESRLSGQCAAAQARATEAEAKIGRLEELAHTLQREVSSKGASMACLEQQLAAARDETATREQAAAASLHRAEEQALQVQAQERARAAAAEAAACGARQETDAQRQRWVAEMDSIQQRFRALLQTKDGTIASLTQQLQELHAVVS
ncbi:Centrosomal protein [Chlorella vulgaris]